MTASNNLIYGNPGEVGQLSTVVIGLTGSFGSGCSFIAKNYITPLGYRYVKLSSFLREICPDHGIKDPSRHDLQMLGSKVRKERGIAYLAERAIQDIGESPSSDKWVIDSIRNEGEVEALRNKYPGFFLVGVFAPERTRLMRSTDAYGDDVRTFRRDDKTDSDEGVPWGQKVHDCFISSDIVLSNSVDFKKGSQPDLDMQDKVRNYVAGIQDPCTIQPSEEEAVMAMAYANGQRSSCLKRKVGAVIIDRRGDLLSSGYNEVPRPRSNVDGDKKIASCKHALGGCYRDQMREDLREAIASVVSDEGTLNRLCGPISRLRALERCRALHAEENAILSVVSAGQGGGLSGATIYTTTHPCMGCSKKIAQVGIARVVYFEPYPDEDARVVLSENGVAAIPFEGVTFRGYFRVFGGARSGNMPAVPEPGLL